jgi:hypothetical protein
MNRLREVHVYNLESFSFISDYSYGNTFHLLFRLILDIRSQLSRHLGVLLQVGMKT